MVTSSLPFETGSGHGEHDDASKCPVFRMLPKELQDESKAKAHLWTYLHMLPLEKHGVPEYHEALSRSMGELKNPNLIYPVGNGIFIHIYPDPNDARDYYIAVEPGMTEDLSTIVDDVESRLVDYVGDLDDTEEDNGKRAEVLLKSVDKICVVKKDNSTRSSKRNGKGTNSESRGKVEVSPSQFTALRYLMVRDKEGMGPLDPLIHDPYIEDISCSGLGTLFIEHKIFKSLKASISFNSHEQLDSFVIRMSEKIGKPVTFRDPIVDATLPDGSRINIVFGGDLSKRGSNFTIRKFSTTPISMTCPR